jgi:predicted 2-oxoglutarate/Fe(II)-dependent dioxygenase YbiX
MIDKNDLFSYVRLYKDIFNPEFCAEIVEGLGKLDWERHSFYNYAINDYVSFENELSVARPEDKQTKRLQDDLWNVIHKYIVEDLSSPYFDGWNGYTQVRYNKYDVGTEMHLHCDHIRDIFEGERKGVPVLSIVGTLNDNYEGGEFVMLDRVIEIPAGSVLVFPSNFMFPHKVNSVTSGVRFSYVSWVW